MSALAQRVIDDALELDLEDRAEVAAALISSLHPPPPADEAAWLAELERRARGALAGAASSVAWEDARRELEARFGG